MMIYMNMMIMMQIYWINTKMSDEYDSVLMDVKLINLVVNMFNIINILC